MASFKVEHVSIRGVSACVPKNVEENSTLPFYEPEEAAQVIEKIGIERKHVAPADVTVADMCFGAAKSLIDQLGWEKESIDILALCTQNPDYLNHPTSFIVHNQLGLPDSTMCLDFFHGCPGWVVSLSSVSNLVSTGCLKRAILLDGDSVSKTLAKTNREERPLFGDAGTAIALEYDVDAKPMFFNIGTMSEDGKALINPRGGFKNPHTVESLKRELDAKAGLLSMDELDHKMDSMDIFSFAITKIPKSLKKLCSDFELCAENIDKLVLHQANKLIVENIAKRMKVPMEKVPLGLRNYGNTTSASIPLTIVSECQKDVAKNQQKFLVCGFGTGLSWGSAYFETNEIACPNVVEI